MNEFEKYPALASWMERLANTGTDLPLGDWMVFCGALNLALTQAASCAADASQVPGMTQNPSHPLSVGSEASTRIAELEAALGEIHDGMLASRQDIDVDDWIEIAGAALPKPPRTEGAS